MTGMTRKRLALSEGQRALFEELLRQEGVESAPEQRIPPRAEHAVPPLSFGQQRLWFLEQLQPGNPAYAIARAFSLRGPVSVPALFQSLQEVVRRHEVLRTTFPTVAGQARQVIHPTLRLALPVIDLRRVDEPGRTGLMRHLLSEQASRPFDLATGPLLCAMLLRMGAQESVLLLKMHHMVSDAWSLGIVYRELSLLYTAFLQGQPSPLPPLPIQYADYALWQQEQLQGARLSAELSYWRHQLAGAPTVLELPTDRPRPQAQGTRGALQTRWLPSELLEQLKKLGQREECTLYMVLLTAFALLLSRYSGQEEVVVGSPIAGRTRAETEPLVGFFVNTLALRADLRGNPSVRQALARVRETTLGAYAHQDLPFEKLVEALQPVRTMSQNPLFQALLALQNVSAPDLAFADLRLTPLEIGLETTRFDLALYAQESEQGLELTAVYSTALFDAPTIGRMLDQLRVLLESIVADPGQRVRALPLLTAGERARSLVTWNSARSLSRRERCLHTLFAEQVARCPDAVALVYEEQRYTYRALDLRANQLAHALRKLGVGPEVAVGLYMERSPQIIIALLGVLKAGGAYVPIDPDMPAARVAFIVEDAGLPLLLTTEQQAPVGATVRTCCLGTGWPGPEEGENCGERPPESGVQASNLAYIIYTSGSTGKPKGVAVEHRQIVHYLCAIDERLLLRPQASFALLSTMAADLGHTALFPALCGGGCLHLISRDQAAAPEALADYFRRQAIDCLKIVPSHLAALLSVAHPQDLMPRQQLVLGGEASRPAWFASLHSLAPACRIMNHYGPTETTVGALTWQYDEVAGEQIGATVPLGRPLPGVSASILDAYLQPVPVGVPGELFIGGEGVTRGYLKRPELTAERFLPHPAGERAGERLYRTGDRARSLPDGRIEFLGRVDLQIKIRGFRIEPGEIERVLEQHPQVRQAVVLAREQASGNQALVAYLTWHQGPGESAGLRAYLQERLPEYMVPTSFVTLERIPLTPNGKVDRSALPTGLQQAETRLAATGPRTEAERRLAEIWAEVLHLRQVGIHENFFELGGDSILSILIISRARQAGLEITPRQMFQCQTIAELAEAIDGGNVICAEQGPVTGMVPLTPIQHWLFAQQLPAVHHRNQSMLLETRQRLDPAGLAQACALLLAHHDALRLRFRQTERGWEQFEAPVADQAVPFCVVDLAQRAGQDQLAALEQVAAAAQSSLDLEHGPLVRIILFRLEPQRADRLLVLIHHLAVDGVSWRLLLEDLQTLYRQWHQGQALRLPAKTTAFQYWATRLQAYARTQAARAELACWRSLCTRDTAAIPLDEVRGENTVASQRAVTVELDRQGTLSLLQHLPGRYHARINDLLLAALAVTLARWTDATSFLVALEGHGREDLFEDVDLSRTVGWFTSLVPVLLEVSDPHRPAEVVHAVHQQLLRPAHHGIGYGILRFLGEPQIQEQVRALSRAQVTFNYLGQFDQSFEASSLFNLPQESVSLGPDACPDGRRASLLEITGSVSGGQLAMHWIYSEHLHRPATIERLARMYLAVLRELIADAPPVEACQEYTAADFALAGLDEETFAALAAQLDADSDTEREVLG